jgi:sterol desaturase/sphingolipid hydroxylase (fatty acid hydroxylase superfamily)
MPDTMSTNDKLNAALEWVACLLFVPLFLYASVVLIPRFEVLTAIGLLLLGWIAGDLLSGIVHWGLDNYFSTKTPIIGPTLVKAFRDHHTDEQLICRKSLVENLGHTCIAADLLLVALLIAPAVWFSVFSLGVILAGVLTNLIHRLAHAQKVSRLVRALQKARILLSPEHHQHHHTSPYQTNYCITAGWWNPVLEKVKFFARMEKMLAAVGIRPDASS